MNQKKPGLIMTLALLLAIITGCSDGSSSSRGGAGSGPAVGFVLTSANFEVGNLSTIASTSPRETTTDILGDDGVHPDSVIREFGGFVFIIQRFFGNSIVVIDPKNPGTPFNNYTTNDIGVDKTQQSNPQDIAFVSLSKAYVSRYGLNTILVVNPLTGDQLGTIDLEQFKDSDGIVEMDQMVIVKGKLYVALQRLNNFVAENKSFVVVIDTKTDEIIDVDPTIDGVQAIVLKGKNPFGGLIYLPVPDKIYVANTGTFFATKNTADAFGGVEVIDPNTDTSEGIIISDNDLGGALGATAILSETVAYATIIRPDFISNFVVPVNLLTKKVGSPLGGIETGPFPSLAFDKTGFLYIADQDITNPGIQVFDTLTNEKVEGPIDTGLPPSDIVFVTP